MLLGLGVLLDAGGSRADDEAILRIESNERGEIRLEAHGARLADTLRAVAAETGIEVVIEEMVERPPVDVDVRSTNLEEMLRQVLRGRNYALFYDAEGALTRVMVLPPSSAPPPRRRARGVRARGVSGRR
jgi:hypothetical protein